MKILKFGGKSAANGEGLERILTIIDAHYKDNQEIAVVLSARANATDELEDILEKAGNGIDYKDLLNDFKDYQLQPCPSIDFSEEFELLDKIFEGVSLINDYSLKIKDQVLAQGEIIATKMLSRLLEDKDIKTQ